MTDAVPLRLPDVAVTVYGAPTELLAVNSPDAEPMVPPADTLQVNVGCVVKATPVAS